MRVLGIDCGAERTGYGIIDSDGRIHRLISAGVIRTGFETEKVPVTSFEEVDLKLAQSRALGQRPEIKQAELSMRQAEYDRRMAKADYIPDVGIAFNYASNFNVDVLPKNMTDLADCPVAVIGGDVHQNRRAAGPVSFEHHFFNLPAFKFPGPAHNGPFDVVRGHTHGLGSQDGSAQARVHVGVTPVAGRDRNFLDDARETFSAFCVQGRFFMLDRRPF